MAAAATLDVQPGAQLRGIDFALSKARTVRVRGRVTTPPETARRSVNIMFLPRGYAGTFGMNRTTLPDPQGAFEFRGVAPGAYTLVAIVMDGERALTTRQPVDVGEANVENLNVVLTPGMEVTGQVRAEGADAPDLSPVRVMLRPRDAAGVAFGPMPMGNIKENGAFTLANAGPDIYTLQLYGLPDGYWVKSVRLGDEDAIENGFNLTRGAAGTVSVVIAPNAGQVEGAVVDAK